MRNSHNVLIETRVKQLELELKQYCIAWSVDEEVLGAELDIRVHGQYSIEYLAHLFQAHLRIPAKVLQENRIIAEYPSSLWQHLKKALRLKYETRKIRLNEYLMFPTIKMPPFAHRLSVQYTDGP